MPDSAGANATLVVYGVPPSMRLLDVGGRALGKRFELTRSNQGTFGPALRLAIAAFLGRHVDVQGATMAFPRNADDFLRVIRGSSARRVIYYGHALGDGQGLLFSIGHSIEPWKLAEILKESEVTDFDILGCEGMPLAAKLSLELPKTRIGYLRAKREDNIEVDRYSGRVKKLEFDDQPLYHFPKRAQ